MGTVPLPLKCLEEYFWKLKFAELVLNNPHSFGKMEKIKSIMCFLDQS
jgi:hypothetical protein